VIGGLRSLMIYMFTNEWRVVLLPGPLAMPPAMQ